MGKCAPQYGGGCENDRLTFGTGLAHCAVCHETFAGVTGFDEHRATASRARVCIYPMKIKNVNGFNKYKKDERGIWVNTVPNTSFGGQLTF